MILSSFSKTKTTAPDVIIIVSGSSVETSLVRKRSDGTFDLLGSDVHHFVYKSANPEEQLNKAINSSLHILLERLEKNRTKTESRETKSEMGTAQCFFSAPYATIKLEFVGKSNPKPFFLKNDTVHAMFAEKENDFLQQTSDEKQLPGAKNKKMEIIDRKLLKMQINGYPVERFLSREANQFEASLLFCGISSKLLEKTEDAIHSVIRRTTINSHSLDIAVYTELSSLLPGLSNYLYCIILQDRTVLNSVKDGVLTETASVDFGGAKIFKELTRELSAVREVTESYIRLYNENKLHGTIEMKVEKVISKLANEWSKEIEAAIPKVNNEIIPPKFFFIVPWSDTEMFLAKHVSVLKSDPASLATQFSVDVVTDEKVKTLAGTLGKKESKQLLSLLLKYLIDNN